MNNYNVYNTRVLTWVYIIRYIRIFEKNCIVGTIQNCLEKNLISIFILFLFLNIHKIQKIFYSYLIFLISHLHKSICITYILLYILLFTGPYHQVGRYST